MKKTLDRYSVLFVYYTITKGDIMNNLDNQTTRPKTGVIREMKVLKGNQLISYLMYQFDYTRKQAEMMESRMPGGFEVQVIY
jgi:hypothetical protein